MLIVEGSEVVSFKDDAEMEKVAVASEACSTKIYDEVGEGSAKIPAGCRVLMRKPAPGKDVAGRRRACAAYVRSQTNIRQLRVLMRPLGTQREPPLDPFGRELFAKEEVHLRKLAEQSGLS